MASNQEAFWVLRAQAGDREALELLLRAVQPALGKYVRGLVGPDDADDVVQQVLLVIYRKLWWLTKAELFRPWAFRIASRTAFRHLKAARRWSQQAGDDEYDTLVAPEPSPQPGAVEALLRDIDLTPASRAVLLLHFDEEMTLGDVSAVLEIPLGTVKSRLAYGLAALRRHPHFARKP